MKNKAVGRPPNTSKKFIESLVHAENGCHLWVGGFGRGGYGKLKFNNHTWSAHRLAWVIANGPIPSGKQVNHGCDNRPCCNPDHLTVGSQKQNIQEAVSRGRMANGDRQGLRVHPEARPFGEKNGSSKLTALSVIEIRASEDSEHAIAEKFGVCVGTVSQIRRRVSWKHI